MAAVPRWCAKRLSTYQCCLGLRLEFMVLFQHGTPDKIVQWVQIWRVWGPLILVSEPRSVCLQPVLHLREKCWVSWSAVLLEDEACQWWPLRAFAVRVSPSQSLHPHLSTKKRLFSEPPTYYQKKQRLKGVKLEMNFSKVVQQRYVGGVGKSITFVLHIIPLCKIM